MVFHLMNVGNIIFSAKETGKGLNFQAFRPETPSSRDAWKQVVWNVYWVFSVKVQAWYRFLLPKHHK